WNRAAYGAGIIPGLRVSEANISGVALKENWPVGSVSKAANILPPMEKTRFTPHFTSSVACGRDRQNWINLSRFITLNTRQSIQNRVGSVGSGVLGGLPRSSNAFAVATRPRGERTMNCSRNRYG